MADRHIDYLIVGGGTAGASAAGTLRREGADGSVMLVGREPVAPYDRPPLSKGYLKGDESKDDALINPPSWYEEQQIELATRVSVTGLDLDERTAKLSTRESVSFGKLLLATGSNVRRMGVEGEALQGIHYLRVFANADDIREDCAGKNVVLVGGSYIASEVAATLTQLGSVCTQIMQEPVALSRTFGERSARFLENRLVEHGVRAIPSETVVRFEGAGDRVTTVVCESGREFAADAVVVGAGVNPDLMLARRAGLELGDHGGVTADATLQTSAEGVYVAGDIADYVSVVNGGRTQRIEHWDVAFQQGRTAARNMLGQGVEHDAVPYFFSDLADWASLEYVGPAYEWDREVLRGSYEEAAFTVFYVQSGVVQGALSVGRSDDLQAARRLIAGQVDLGDGAGRLGDLSADLDEIGT